MSAAPLRLHPDRLFPADPDTRAVARRLYAEVADLPIVSPHGHTDPRWFAEDTPFGDASSLLLQPDHYVIRMLYSQGVPLEAIGIGAPVDPRAAWRVLADHYHLFRGTPSRLWLDWVFHRVFGLDVRLAPETASTSNSPAPNSARARCSTGSTSSCWRPLSPRSTRSTIMPRSAPRGGRAG